MNIDAVGALSSESNGNSNQFFIFYRNCSLGDGCLVKGPKGLHHLRCEPLHYLELREVFFVIHNFVLFGVGAEKLSSAPGRVPGVIDRSQTEPLALRLHPPDPR